jgi:hypothetical protein
VPYLLKEEGRGKKEEGRGLPDETEETGFFAEIDGLRQISGCKNPVSGYSD